MPAFFMGACRTDGDGEADRPAAVLHGGCSQAWPAAATADRDASILVPMVLSDTR